MELYLSIFNPKGMNTLIGYDLVPEAKILDSALRACRRLDDLASAIRILEAVKVSSRTLVGFTSTLPSKTECSRSLYLSFTGCKVSILYIFAGQGWQPQRYLPLPNPRADTHLVRTWHFNTWRAWHWQVIDHWGKPCHLGGLCDLER